MKAYTFNINGYQIVKWDVTEKPAFEKAMAHYHFMTDYRY